MILLCIIGVIVLAAPGALGYSMKDYFPRSRSCGARYQDYYDNYPWVCRDSKFNTPYPSVDVNALLVKSEYDEMNYYLNVTRKCHSYVSQPPDGANEYYKYQSICKAIRTQVHVIWARVPGYQLKGPEKKIHNDGLMPVHVLEGQFLFELECVHPWATGLPAKMKARYGGRSAKDIYKGAKRHLCQLGYNYNRRYMCKPDNFVTREVLVYSPHANIVFPVQIPNVPTACSCGTCFCNNQQRRRNPLFHFGF